MIDYILFGFCGLSFVFLVLALIFIIKGKQFEDDRLSDGISVFIFGLIFLCIYLLIKSLYYADILFHEFLLRIENSLPGYISYLNTMADVSLIPLFAICLFVAVILFREI